MGAHTVDFHQGAAIDHKGWYIFLCQKSIIAVIAIQSFHILRVKIKSEMAEVQL